jgi:hypothetical protein
MHKYLSPLIWTVLATLIGVRVEASTGNTDDQGPTLSETRDWLKNHGSDFTSSFSFSNDSHKNFTLTVQKVEFLFKKYHPNASPFEGCMVHFYASIHIKEDESDSDGGAYATFRAEDVSDVVEVRKLKQEDLGPDAQGFDAQGCYGLVITPKDNKSDAIAMANLGAPFLQWHKLSYIVIPITDYAMAQRLAKALHHGIQLIQAQTTAKPESF